MLKLASLSLLVVSLLLAGCGGCGGSSWYANADPVEEARIQTSKGNFGLMGLAVFEKEDFWIPGVVGHKNGDPPRRDVTWHGVSGQNDPYFQYAQPYMKQFNRIILESRKGQTIDSYGLSAKNKDFHPSEIQPAIPKTEQ